MENNLLTDQTMKTLLLERQRRNLPSTHVNDSVEPLLKS